MMHVPYVFRKKDPPRRLRVVLGGVCLLVLALAGVFGSSVAFARPVPPGVEGEPVVSAAQQCLHGDLALAGSDMDDPEHSTWLGVKITNHCGIPVTILDYQLYFYTTCPATNEPRDTLTTLRLGGGWAVIADGGTLWVDDIHTTHCVVCNEALQPSGWPHITVDVGLIDIHGTHAKRTDGPDVYSDSPTLGTVAYDLVNGPSVGDEQRCHQPVL